MAKILLVEDDKNLLEIYGARLMAEGYEIVTAQDGEEGLAVASREKPDLIITDAMMPRVSGLQFLDILRSTPSTAEIKVIAMTALSQAEDRAQFEKLGVERFLVKSQVTLEDVTRIVSEVLNGTPAVSTDKTAESSMSETTGGTPMPPATPTNEPVAPEPAMPASGPVTTTPASEPVIITPTNPAPAATDTPVTDNASATAPSAEPVSVPVTSADPVMPTTSDMPVIEPPTEGPSTPAEAPAPAETSEAATPTQEEQTEVDQQIQSFIDTSPVVNTPAAEAPAMPDEPAETTPETSPTPETTPAPAEPKSDDMPHEPHAHDIAL